MTDDAKVILARIDERLGAHMETSVRWQGDTTTKIDGIETKMAQDNVRLDRIEQREVGRARIMWMAITAAVAGLVASIKNMLR